MKSKYCNEINDKILDKEIILFGWVNKKIILKNIIFIELRDNTGYLNLVFKDEIFNKNINNIKNISIESCIKVIGKVSFKKKDNIKNKNIFEIIVKKYKIIEKSEILPIKIDDENNSDNIKLKFRYLFLRKSKIFNNLIIKSNIIWYINYFMKKNKFLYIETPILSKPSIEGSKNFITKSSKYKNKYFSLSESPQIFKQILMISGFNKYYQLAKCFRDEDSRSNRQPEFTQIDIEASFINEDYIIKLCSKLITFIFKKINNINIEKIPIYTYKEVINEFGVENPDLRSNLKIISINNLLIKYNIIIDDLFYYIYIIHCNKKIDKDIIYKYFINNNLKIIFSDFYNLKKDLIELNLSNKFNLCINNLIEILKNLIKDNNYIMIFISCNDSIKVLGKFVKNISNKFNLINKNKTSILWVKDFPMFKKNKYGDIESYHHPFTSPKYFSKIFYKIDNIFSLISNSYDLIINGNEIASGSVRINNKNIQKKVFDILKISKYNQKKIFGFFLESLKYGTPPHAGIAIGLDRLTMIITDSINIKDVIAFPKSTSLFDFMTNSPIKIKV